VAENTDFHLADQNVVVANVLFFGKSQAAELFQVMMSYAGTAKIQGFLYFTYPNGVTAFQQVPVDSPGFTAESIL